jgi:chromosome segregation ATPase
MGVLNYVDTLISDLEFQKEMALQQLNKAKRAYEDAHKNLDRAQNNFDESYRAINDLKKVKMVVRSYYEDVAPKH